MSLFIDLDMAMDLVQGAIERKGADTLGQLTDEQFEDFAYGVGDAPPRCVYAFHDDSGALVPVCIIGNIFNHLGLVGLLVSEFSGPNTVPDQKNALLPVDREDAAPNTSGDHEAWLTREEIARSGFEFSTDAWEFLRLVQDQQDRGNTWGVALYRAMRAMLAKSE